MAIAPPVDLADLAALRGLARSLAAGEADADDLIQDTAVAALEHPPAPDRPARPWLAAILRNRWRMDRRASARRRDREAAAAAPEPALVADDLIVRARTLERLATALVALDEPFRTAVILRYLDGHSAAEIAARLDVPAGTVRWRLKIGRDRLRAALDAAAPRRAGAGAILAAPWAPAMKGLAIMKVKSQLVLTVVLILAMLAGGIAVYVGHDRAGSAPRTAVTSTPAQRRGPVAAAPGPTAPSSVAPTRDADGVPGQTRAVVVPIAAPGGQVVGRVINWSTGEGVGGAELVFDGDVGATTVRSDDAGRFELAPPAPGRFRLATATAPGFLPYAPEWQHSQIAVETTADRGVRGVTVFLFPAVDYTGTVVDAGGAPVRGAVVRLLGSPAGEQAIERLATEWTTGADGSFVFHAPDDAVLEAEKGAARGRARLDGGAALTHALVIQLGDVAAADRAITGRVIDERGAGVADALVRAVPALAPTDQTAHATAFATSGPDGRFAVAGVEAIDYRLSAEVDERAPAVRAPVAGGARDVTLEVVRGPTIAGVVRNAAGDAVPAFTLVVSRRQGVIRELVAARSIVSAAGRFEVPVAEGSYELVAYAPGWAPGRPTAASAGDREVELAVSEGAVLRGTVVSAVDRLPLPYARVMREASGGGASAAPANAGTVTRADGTFELAGIPPGPVAVTIAGGGFHPRIEAGLVAHDGESLGPITVALAPLAPGEAPTLELVGIGVQLTGDGDTLRVTTVIADGGAARAGIVVGDRLTQVDGVAVTELGLDGAIGRIRGAAGTTLRVTVLRGDATIELVVERRPLRA